MFRQAVLTLVRAPGGGAVLFKPMAVEKGVRAQTDKGLFSAPCQAKQWPASGGARRGSKGCSVSAAGSGFHTGHICAQLPLNPPRAIRSAQQHKRLHQPLVSSAADGIRLWPQLISQARQSIDSVLRGRVALSAPRGHVRR